MLALHPQYIIDDTQTQKAVVIQMNEWQKIMQQLEMLDDIEVYDKAKKTNSEVISFSQAVKEIKNH
ncbi:MAG: hypothetical protein Ctma_0321 [Catillopecten margaritatus gill symbiont]|uniref:Prevent-host-death protein n=1 Tax=Catillopecten margaritatus gill symbiont TaxID=3083288 RepID=A0AAU6PF45_9GAMM